ESDQIGQGRVEAVDKADALRTATTIDTACIVGVRSRSAAAGASTNHNSGACRGAIERLPIPRPLIRPGIGAGGMHADAAAACPSAGSAEPAATAKIEAPAVGVGAAGCIAARCIVVGKIDAGQRDRTGGSDEQAATKTRAAAAAISSIATMRHGIEDA